MREMMMEMRRLGGLEVSAVGLGCFAMSGAYGSVEEAEAVGTIRRAIELGCTFLDTAEAYGPFTNEVLVGKAIRGGAGRREEVVIATKFGYPLGGKLTAEGRSRPEAIRASVEGSLKRLGVETVDLLYQHRVDPTVPMEEVAGTVSELVKEGKARFFGLSEAGVGSIRRAHAVLPVAALQSEYSLWERNLERDVLPVLKELGIGLVPYCPLGRGFLTGEVKRGEEYPEGDFRRTDPRYQGKHFDANKRAVEVVRKVATAKGILPGQVALAWLLHKGEGIVPIPGTRRRWHVEENAAAVRVVLTAGEMGELDEALSAEKVSGPRYGEERMGMIDR